MASSPEATEARPERPDWLAPGDLPGDNYYSAPQGCVFFPLADWPGQAIVDAVLTAQQLRDLADWMEAQRPGLPIAATGWQPIATAGRWLAAVQVAAQSPLLWVPACFTAGVALGRLLP